MAHSKGPSTLLQQENGLNGLDNELNKDVRMDGGETGRRLEHQ